MADLNVTDLTPSPLFAPVGEPDRTPRRGYTLPVFACAGAIAALQVLRDGTRPLRVAVDLLEPAETVAIAIAQVAPLSPTAALAITHSDPGDNLDLTRDTPIWSLVEWAEATQAEPVAIVGGEGLGHHADGTPAIYGYAQRLLRESLGSRLQPGEKIRVTVILPDGRALAERTSNAAFGVVEGLSLLGTSGVSQPLSAPGQLEAFRQELCQKAADVRVQNRGLVFCIGENGLDLIQSLGVEAAYLVKTANWLGPMLVEAGLQGVRSILLFGYHGKLIKLAGGIFHSHHHVADGRLEILAAHCANQGLPTADVRTILASATAEAGFQHLRQIDAATGSPWVETVYGAIAQMIDQRAQAYIHTHSSTSVTVGSILFDRNRKIIVQSEMGATLLSHLLTAAD
jgi:cobalt-precorrin-5B (C1)-methyltransferase